MKARSFEVCEQLSTINNSAVDVIMPIFNEAKWLSTAITSLYTQTLPPKRIIVVNDASTDESPNILKKLLEKIPTLEIISLKSNVGSLEALKLGYMKSNSKYVVFASAHCEWKANFLESLVSKLENNKGVCLACCQVLQIQHNINKFVVKPSLTPIGETKYLNAHESISSLRKSDNWILSMGTVYRSECVKRFRMFDQNFGSMTDGYINRKMMVRNGFYFVSEVLCKWNLLDSSQSFRLSHNPIQSNILINRICDEIRNDLNFPVWYSKKYYERQHFSNIVRLQNEKDFEQYIQEVSLKSYSRQLLKALNGNNNITRILRIAVIYLDFRPFYLRRLFFLILMRKLRFVRLID